MPDGRKDDLGKLRYDLIPPIALEEVVKVLTYGAQKYAPENWRHVDGWHDRYLAAALRHVFAYMREGMAGCNPIDRESKLSHLAHAVCCLMFMLDLRNAKGMVPPATILAAPSSDANTVEELVWRVWLYAIVKPGGEYSQIVTLRARDANYMEHLCRNELLIFCAQHHRPAQVVEAGWKVLP